MGSRSSGFDEIEAGYPAITDHDEPQEPAYAGDDDDEIKKPSADEEMDELAMAEQEYRREIGSGMMMQSEEDFAI